MIPLLPSLADSRPCVVARCTDGTCLLFVDWIPARDGEPVEPRDSWWEGSTLWVNPANQAAHLACCIPALPASRDFLWVISGPSGILAVHRLEPRRAPSVD